MELTYHLEGIIHSKEEMEDFEGPLNVILMLLSKNKIEIRDIQISEILEQYLAYLAEMEAMDLEVASEFVQMASHLLYIKTRMLLSTQEEVSELELLISSLEQLKARDVLSSVKAVLPSLGEACEMGSRFHVKPPEPLRGSKEYRYQHEGHELLKALSDVLSRSKNPEEQEESETKQRKRIVPKRIIYNVRDKSREILERFRQNECFLLSSLYRESRSRSEVVATFISVLELCSIGSVCLQAEEDDIMIRFSGETVDAALEIIGE